MLLSWKRLGPRNSWVPCLAAMTTTLAQGTSMDAPMAPYWVKDCSLDGFVLWRWWKMKGKRRGTQFCVIIYPSANNWWFRVLRTSTKGSGTTAIISTVIGTSSTFVTWIYWEGFQRLKVLTCAIVIKRNEETQDTQDDWDTELLKISTFHTTVIFKHCAQGSPKPAARAVCEKSSTAHKWPSPYHSGAANCNQKNLHALQEGWKKTAVFWDYWIKTYEKSRILGGWRSINPAPFRASPWCQGELTHSHFMSAFRIILSPIPIQHSCGNHMKSPGLIRKSSN